MLQVAAAAGHSTAVATVATVTAAVQATWGSEKDKLGNPTEWYVADDAVSHTRYFVIQGSDSIDHWKVNLTFDPVVFEDPSLGVKVCPSACPALLLVCRLTCPMSLPTSVLMSLRALADCGGHICGLWQG
jgi:hypothetical protein